MKNIFFFFLFLTSFIINAQDKTCDTPEKDVLEDLSSITKCTIKKGNSKTKKGGQISVRVSGRKKRFLKKRNTSLKSVHGTKLNSNGVANVKYEESAPTIIKRKIRNSLSSEEMKKAEKFITVDEIPVFKKCSTFKLDDRVECFNSEMIKHINKYFSYPNEALIKKIQGEVWIRFIIDKDGNVSNIKAHGPKGGELLKEEAIRVVSHLPIFVPGTKKGKSVSVKYGFPINFSLED